ncbi:MAG TPA: YdeI/OmpD-associated family protein [Chitinophagaceae bacterium]|nr:YdeI/OmpD-associated family protein [Chitinophagaceae bacterium]
MKSFSAKIFKIGVNPYVLLPGTVLNSIFKKAGKNKGAIPVRGTLNGHVFIQTLVKYSGKWRLYLNTPMRKAAGIDVGDTANVKIEYDPEPRIVPMHPTLQQALEQNKKAKDAFEKLTPSRQKEILRYIGFLKNEESVIVNVERVIQNLLGKGRFAGRD